MPLENTSPNNLYVTVESYLTTKQTKTISAGCFYSPPKVRYRGSKTTHTVSPFAAKSISLNSFGNDCLSAQRKIILQTNTYRVCDIRDAVWSFGAGCMWDKTAAHVVSRRYDKITRISIHIGFVSLGAHRGFLDNFHFIPWRYTIHTYVNMSSEPIPRDLPRGVRKIKDRKSGIC